LAMAPHGDLIMLQPLSAILDDKKFSI